MLFDVQADGREAVRVIRAHRRQYDRENVILRRVHAERPVHGDHERSDIERRAGSGRDPVLFEFDELDERVVSELRIDLRNADAPARIEHTLHVLHGTEQPDFARLVAVRFESLEHRLSVVEYGSGRVEHERLVRFYARVFVIPRAVVILHHEHVVGEVFAEFQIGVLVFQLFTFDNLHICILD